jgi:hypothetical protein
MYTFLSLSIKINEQDFSTDMTDPNLAGVTQVSTAQVKQQSETFHTFVTGPLITSQITVAANINMEAMMT